MIAYVDENGVVQIWKGEPVNGFWYQVNVPEIWSDAELNAAGLFRVQEFVPPVGEMLVDTNASYRLEGTVVIQTYATKPLVVAPRVVPLLGVGASVVA